MLSILATVFMYIILINSGINMIIIEIFYINFIIKGLIYKSIYSLLIRLLVRMNIVI